MSKGNLQEETEQWMNHRKSMHTSRKVGEERVRRVTPSLSLHLYTRLLLRKSYCVSLSVTHVMSV